MGIYVNNKQKVRQAMVKRAGWGGDNHPLGKICYSSASWAVSRPLPPPANVELVFGELVKMVAVLPSVNVKDVIK